MGVIRLGGACLFPGLGGWAGRGPAGHPEAEVATCQGNAGPWLVPGEHLWMTWEEGVGRVGKGQESLLLSPYHCQQALLSHSSFY